MSVFLERNHLFARKPSDAGDPVEMAKAGFGILLCNVGDYEPPLWDDLRHGAIEQGIVVGPWLRTGQQEFEPQRLLFLIDVAESWGDAPYVVNSEKEIDHTGSDVTDYIARQVAGDDAAISSEIRPYGNVVWTPLGHLPALPQRFPAEQSVLDDDDEIRRRWYEAGFSCVVITYGTYHGMQPTQFPRLEPYGLYTADDCLNGFMRWGPAGELEGGPCKDQEDDVQRIGSQHGISAAHKRLKDMDPEGSNPAFDPAQPFALPVDSLKAWDKWARTMTILVQDHDASV